MICEQAKQYGHCEGLSDSHPLKSGSRFSSAFTRATGLFHDDAAGGWRIARGGNVGNRRAPTPLQPIKRISFD